MYLPRTFAETEQGVLHAFMDAHPFATLVTANDGLYATHLPLVLRPSEGAFGMLEGHVARANPHLGRFASAAEALVIFSGAQAHITPTWYPSKQVDGRVVPTWNYVAVHAWGTLRLMDDPAELRAHLERLTARHESARGSAWRVDDPPAEYVDQQVKAIVGVEIAITRLEGKWKMSQNRAEADVNGAIAGLRGTGDSMDAGVADIVAERNQER